MTLRDQPAYVIRMPAKPGAGDKLCELAAAGMEKSGLPIVSSFFVRMGSPTSCGTSRYSSPIRQGGPRRQSARGRASRRDSATSG